MKYCRLIVCGLVLATALPAAGSAQPVASPLSATTVKQFVAACQTNKDSCAAEIGTALLAKLNSAPGGVCLTSDGYADAVPAWLAAHPETADMATADGVYVALKSLYPC